MQLRKRAGAVLASLLLTVPFYAALSASAPSAGAATQKPITLKPNQTVSVTNPGFPVGVGAPYSIFFGFPPSDCMDDGNAFAFCDYFPIRLVDSNGKALTPDDFKKRLFSVTYTLEWNTTNVEIPANYPQPTTQYEMSVWDDPAVPDDDPKPCDPNDPVVNFYLCAFVDGGSSGGYPGGDESYYDSLYLQAPEPELFGMVPTRDGYAVTVATTFGPGVPYTLKVGLIEASGNLTDASVDAIKDLSNDTGIATPSAEAPGTALPTIASPNAGGFDLGVTPAGSDSDLDSLQGGGGNDLDLNADEAAAIVRNASAARDVGLPGKASPALLLLWFMGVPVIVGGGALVWFLRRRATLLKV